MKQVYKYLIVIIIASSISFQIKAQGCVAIRSFSGCSGGIGSGAVLTKGEWLAGANFRYFKSYKHFRGTHEETERVDNGTQVINHSYFLDLSVTYSISDRMYASFTLPTVYNERSSMYEHGGNPPNGLGERHTTYSQGIGDIRFGVGYWLLDPLKHTKGNLAVALGIKLPTGNYRAKDLFYNQGEEKNMDVMKYVDQSIQPGDGGTGATIEIQGYRTLSDKFIVNGSMYYLINPRETNGTTNIFGTSEYSVPDQYAIRVGATYIAPLHGLSFYLGMRDEGIPAEDLFGGNDGFRRPGYVISVEPGINYSFGNFIASLNVPVAVERNRTQSYPDKQATAATGEYKHGDAAFADYLINASLVFRIGGKSAPMQHEAPMYEFNQ